jgi:hypothetical protein
VHLAVTQRLTDRLRAFGEEPAGAFTARSLRQVPRSSNPGRPLSEELVRPGLPGVLAQAFSCAGTFARETSTSAVNAAGSLTASSARILRSTSTPATFRPWMKRL